MISTQWPELNELPDEQRDALLTRYAGLRVKLVEMDKAAAKTAQADLTARLGSKEAYDDFFATARQGAKILPKPLREALKVARLPTGQRVVHMQEFVELLHRLGSGQHQAATGQQEGGRTAMLQKELADLEALRDRDIGEYLRPYKNTGLSGSDRALQIARELASEGPAKPSAADLRAEERKLEKLSRDDPQLFQFGAWPGARSPRSSGLCLVADVRRATP